MTYQDITTVSCGCAVKAEKTKAEDTRRVEKTSECEEGVGVQGDSGKEWEHRDIQGRCGSGGRSRKVWERREIQEGVGAEGNPGKEWGHREM